MNDCKNYEPNVSADVGAIYCSELAGDATDCKNCGRRATDHFSASAPRSEGREAREVEVPQWAKDAAAVIECVPDCPRGYKLSIPEGSFTREEIIAHIIAKHAASRLAAAEQRNQTLERQYTEAVDKNISTADRDHWKQRAEAAEQRNAELERERDSWRRTAERLESEKVTAESRLAEARRALETYGDHADRCQSWLGEDCTCGWSALEGKR